MTDILEKLRKLEALRQRAGTEQEAATASLRIQEILQKHNLDIGVLELQQEEGTELPAGPTKRTLPDHWPILAHAVNELLDVESFCRGSDRKGWQYSFIGLKANVEAACLTFPYLIEAVESLLDQWKREPLEPLWSRRPQYRLWNEYGRRDYRAFRIGVSKRIEEIIFAQKRQMGTSMELVHIGNAVARRLFDAMTFDQISQRDCTVPGSYAAAYHAGYERGHLVDPKAPGKRRIRK